MKTTEQASEFELSLRLSPPEPFDVRRLFAFLAQRAVDGVELVTSDSYARSLRLPRAHGLVRLTAAGDDVQCRLTLADHRDLPGAVERCRWLLDMEADPGEIDAHLAADPLLAESVQRMPGLRVPGHVDGFEVAVLAIVGQQISVSAARTIAGRLTAQYGQRLSIDAPPLLSHVFPEPEVLAALDPDTLPMPRARARCLVGVAAAVAAGTVILDRSVERAEVRASLLALTGVGPWTADYIAMRALGDTDVFLVTDLGAQHGLARLGADDPATVVSERWRPWRSYALMHVWAALDNGVMTKESDRS